MHSETTPLWLKTHERADFKREAIMRTAVHLFSKSGFRNTTLESIAASLNITKPAIYHYFAGKDQVFIECIRTGLDALRAAADASVIGDHSTGMVRLRALLTKYGLIMTTDFGGCLLRVNDADLQATAQQTFSALKRDINSSIRKLVEEGVADGSIRPCNVKITTFTLAGALNSISRWYDQTGDMSADEAVQTCVNVLIQGICPVPVARQGAGKSPTKRAVVSA